MQCNAIDQLAQHVQHLSENITTFLSQRLRPNYVTLFPMKLGAFPMLLSALKGGKAWIPGLICGKQAEFNGFQAASSVFHGGLAKEPWNICCGIWLNLHTEHNLVF